MRGLGKRLECNRTMEKNVHWQFNALVSCLQRRDRAQTKSILARSRSASLDLRSLQWGIVFLGGMPKFFRLLSSVGAGDANFRYRAFLEALRDAGAVSDT